LNCFKK